MAKMAIIPPVKVKTRGGLDATIFEIDPDDLQDGISGVIHTPGMATVAIHALEHPTTAPMRPARPEALAPSEGPHA